MNPSHDEILHGVKDPNYLMLIWTFKIHSDHLVSQDATKPAVIGLWFNLQIAGSN